MELFSELYGCYYRVVSQILKNAPLSEQQISHLIDSNAFQESLLYLMPKLCKEDGWGLLTKQHDQYLSPLTFEPTIPITLLEKRWLKSLLQDSRIRLFLEDHTQKELSDKLASVKPLFDRNYFKWFDIFKDGDDYNNDEYVSHFKKVINAIHTKSVITIIFRSGKGKTIKGDYLPYRMEYSQKNDKFRLLAVRIYNHKPIDTTTINIARIYHIKTSPIGLVQPIDFSNLRNRKRCKEPILIEISKERNAIERFMMEFAGYEKHTVSDEDTGLYYATLWYDLQDESELLIKLLSFGPVLLVTGPSHVVTQIQLRVEQQYQLLFQSL